MKALSSVRTLKATGLLFLVNLFAVSLNLWAQDDGAEFALKTAHAVTVHAENGVELKAKFNGQRPVDVIFDTGSMNVMSASFAKKLVLKVAGSGSVEGNGGSVAAKGAMVDNVQIGGVPPDLRGHRWSCWPGG
jgi:hypothetical protein